MAKNNKNKIFIVTLFADSISKKVFAEFQRSTVAEETLNSEHSMEREAKTNCITIKSFRGDKGVFKAAEFNAYVNSLDQSISYCGFGAHHQNGIVERYIRTMVEKSRPVLLNAYARWPKPMKMELWTYEFRHIVTQWNNTPRKDLEYKTPDEKIQWN